MFFPLFLFFFPSKLMTQRDDRWHWNETRRRSVISTDSYEYKDSITNFIVLQETCF